MAEKQRRSLDVWIVETNTVYREVPYAVVTDWVQQGRLLDDDQVRLTGNKEWKRLGDVPSLAAFLPRVEPLRVEDQAEALEQVHVDFGWRKRHDDEDDDVDMIPLIDVSLVLLIFFMLTSTVGLAALIDTPSARYKLLSADADMLWVGIKPAENGQTVYLLGGKEGEEAQQFNDRGELLAGLDARLAGEKFPVKINIKAHRGLTFDVVRDLTTALEDFKRTDQNPAGKVTEVFTEVSEKEGS
jgi:biopolymer transport protein ExbD